MITYKIKNNQIIITNKTKNSIVETIRDDEGDKISKMSCTYSDGNKITELYELWLNKSKKWKKSYKHTYTYDNNGNELTHISKEWINNTFMNRHKITQIYDNMGNQLTYLHQYWLNNVWVNSTRNTYTYDNDENRLTSLYEIWRNNTWEKTYY